MNNPDKHSKITISVNPLNLWGALNETIHVLDDLISGKPVQKDEITLSDIRNKLKKLQDQMGN